MNSLHLAPKFNPYILNNQENELHSKLDEIFQDLSGNDKEILAEANGFEPLGGKSHIVGHPDLQDWIIKGPRHDDVIWTLPDTHIYRVRKATRLQKIIKKHGFSEVVIPEKLLYEHNNQWFVICEKIELDEKVTVDSTYRNKKKSLLWDWGKEHKEITSVQAKEIATLCFEGGLEDIGSENINFTEDGKIAIVDTEPVSRAVKKSLKAWFSIIPNLKFTFLFLNSLTSTEYLHLLCQQEACEEIRQVQSQNFWKYLTKVVTEVALPLVFSVGVLSLSLCRDNANLARFAVIAVAVSGANAVMGLALMTFTTWRYHYVRSLQGHFELLMARG